MLLEATGDRALERYRLFMLAAQGPLPEREGVIFETAFVGPGCATPGSGWTTCRCASHWCPRLFGTLRPPDAVLLHTSPRAREGCRSGSRSTCSRRRSKQVRARGGLVIAQINPRMPYTFGDSELARGT